MVFKDMSTSPIRGLWSSRLAFILATTGAAVGVGNIWKFPYMAGENGGSAFVLVYILAVVFIGLPLMLAEMLIGHRARHNPIDSLRLLAKEANSSTHWSWLGWLNIITLILMLSFYSVISGWSLSYLCRSLLGQLNGLTPTEILSTWQQFLASPWSQIGWHTVFIVLTLWVVERGVQHGLELANRWMMPMLFLVLIILDIYSMQLPGFSQACQFLFELKTYKINSAVIIAAMGHAFFTLAIGAGAMLVYGSYVPRGSKLYAPIMITAILDLAVALFAGLAIFAIVFTIGHNPEGGPGLLFEVLPIAFATMKGGQFIGSLFFLLFIFAAWTSSLSMAEPVVVMLAERYTGSRLKASAMVGSVAWLLGIGSCLSFNLWKDATLFHHWNFFSAITDLVTNILLPTGGLFFAIFAGWVMSKESTQEELNFPHSWLYFSWRFLVRFIAPIGILLIFINAFWN